jgi:hypothetical protein
MPRKTNPKIAKQLKTWNLQNEARLRIAKAHFDAQDKETQEAISYVRDRIVSYSSGHAVFYPEGKRQPAGLVVEIDPEMILANALYMATMIFKDLATMDVQVANYQFPDLICAECGEPVRKDSVRKRSRRK